jgi:hypothetical protein
VEGKGCEVEGTRVSREQASAKKNNSTNSESQLLVPAVSLVVSVSDVKEFNNRPNLGQLFNLLFRPIGTWNPKHALRTRDLHTGQGPRYISLLNKRE